jgi:hypothetical protein
MQFWYQGILILLNAFKCVFLFILWNTLKSNGNVYMYVNTKMILVETVPGIRRGEWKRAVEGVNLSMIYLIHCKKLCKCYNVPPPSTTVKKILKKSGRIQQWFHPVLKFSLFGQYLFLIQSHCSVYIFISCWLNLRMLYMSVDLSIS